MSGMRKIRRLAADALTPEGRRSVVSRIADRVGARVMPSLTRSHVLASDVRDAAAVLRAPSPRPAGKPLRIGWIVTPPHAGSGGHTTAFRMVRELVRAGHRCELVLYDVFDGSLADQAAEVRRGWPELDAEVRSIEDGLGGFDVCVATGWQTAYALAARSAGLDLHRCYFIQDYEPFFYPRGFEYALAEGSYSLGLHRIALGEMVAHRLREQGASCDAVPFGCDTETYRLLPARGPRSGVVFYTRPGTARRGFLLAAMGLQEFHERRPEVPIRVFGPLERSALDFPVSWQGLLAPGELNELYNRSVAGLGMSFTNTSLVVGEMLAAGCVPVVNDSPDARLDIASRHVRWVAPRPADVAAALVELTDDPPGDVSAIAGSTNPSWERTQTAFREALLARVSAEEGEHPCS